MPKVNIRKDDHLRVLLTDLLPYEVPFIFSNEGFYKQAQEYERSKIANTTDEIPQIVKRLLFDYKPKPDYGIPFEYKIRKDGKTYRRLSIIHPGIQYRFVDFYLVYEHQIINLCRRSDLTLRSPKKIATSYYERDDSSAFQESGEDVLSHGSVESEASRSTIKYASSYFSYEGPKFLYQFFDSYQFHRIEKRFSRMASVDVSKCFSSIYTHSIAWAVKSKEFTKDNLAGSDNTFEFKIDKLFQIANYNETNGIIIGPEISRIFAEIIFQRIDLNIKEKLKKIKNDHGKVLSHKKDYEIKRYIDDYYIFSNSENIQEKIIQIISSCLEDYRLYLNESKTVFSYRPFITKITASKIEVRKEIKEFFNIMSFIKDNNDGNNKKYVNKNINFIRKSNQFIRDIKIILNRNEVGFNNVSNVLFSAFYRKLSWMLAAYENGRLESADDESFAFSILAILDVLFFAYAMDSRTRPTYLLGKTIIKLAEFWKNRASDAKELGRRLITSDPDAA